LVALSDVGKTRVESILTIRPKWQWAALMEPIGEFARLSMIRGIL
jgi:hypothetical protein